MKATMLFVRRGFGPIVLSTESRERPILSSHEEVLNQQGAPKELGLSVDDFVAA
jgi:hypothetical protein